MSKKIKDRFRGMLDSVFTFVEKNPVEVTIGYVLAVAAGSIIASTLSYSAGARSSARDIIATFPKLIDGVGEASCIATLKLLREYDEETYHLFNDYCRIHHRCVHEDFVKAEYIKKLLAFVDENTK